MNNLIISKIQVKLHGSGYHFISVCSTITLTPWFPEIEPLNTLIKVLHGVTYDVASYFIFVCRT
jgi:hypothetical protein